MSNVWNQELRVEIDARTFATIVVVLVEDTPSLLVLADLGMALIQEARKHVLDTPVLNVASIKAVVQSILEGVGEGVSAGCAIVVVAGDNVIGATKGEIALALLRTNKFFTLLGYAKDVGGVRGQIVAGDQYLIQSPYFGEVSVLPKKVVLVKEERKVAPIYLQHPDYSRRYRNIGLGLFAFLVVTVALGAWRRQVLVKDQQLATIEQVVESARTQIMDVIKTDPERARKIIDDASRQVEEYRNIVKGKEQQKAQLMVDDLARYKKEVFKENEATLLTFAELGLLEIDNPPGQIILGTKGMLYFVERDKVAGISTADKSQIKVTLEGGDSPVDIAFVGDSIYELNNSGIIGGAFKDKAKLSELASADEAWSSPSRIGVFGSSLYVLDVGTGEISKYVASEGKLSGRKRWFGAGIMLDLSKIVDMVVDGDVWLVSASGKLEKFSRGAPAKFEMEGFANENGEKKFADPIAVATTEFEVYVLERGKGRVVVFDRDGKYLRQYLNSQFGEGKDLVVWEGKGYVLTEKEIKVFGL